MTRSALARKAASFDFRARLNASAQAVELHPQAWRGRWRWWQPGLSSRDFAADLEETAAAMASGAWFQDGARMRGTGCEDVARGAIAVGADADAATMNTGTKTGSSLERADSASEASAPAPAGASTGEPAPSDRLPKAVGNPLWENVVVDLGCGKGERTVALALAHPRTLFIGIDNDAVCSLQSAERAVVEGARNAVFPLSRNPIVSRLLAPGEVTRLEITYPTPFPKKKHAERRLTHLIRLLDYRDVLAPGATLRLATDSQPMFDFSKTQLELARYRILWCTSNLREDYPDEPLSGYEMKTAAKGGPVLALEATPSEELTPRAEDVPQTAPMSLYAYLPLDLDELEYVPHGMENAIANERCRRANAQARGLTLRPGWEHGNE